jgi:hypothetical protein
MIVYFFDDNLIEWDSYNQGLLDHARRRAAISRPDRDP